MIRSRRVAVASPQTRLAMARRRTGLRVEPPHLAPAEVALARRIHHTQLRKALVAVALLAAGIVGLPMLLAAFPALDHVRVLDIPVSWLSVAVLPFPLLALLAWWQLRRAERVERREQQ